MDKSYSAFVCLKDEALPKGRSSAPVSQLLKHSIGQYENSVDESRFEKVKAREISINKFSILLALDAICPDDCKKFWDHKAALPRRTLFSFFAEGDRVLTHNATPHRKRLVGRSGMKYIKSFDKKSSGVAYEHFVKWITGRELKAQGLGVDKILLSQDLLNQIESISEFAKMFRVDDKTSGVARKFFSQFVFMICGCVRSSSVVDRSLYIIMFFNSFDIYESWIHPVAQSLAQVFQGALYPNTYKAQARIEGDGETIFVGLLRLFQSVLSIKNSAQVVKDIERSRRLDSWVKSCVNMGKVFQFLKVVFDLIHDYIQSYCLGVDVTSIQLMKVEANIPSWMDQVLNLYSNDGVVRSGRDHEVANEVKELFEKGSEYLMLLKKANVNAKSFTAFTHVWRALGEMMKERIALYGSDRLRVSPFVLHLIGTSGVGKSTLTHFVARDLFKGRNMEFDRKKDMYVRNETQDHWDGYTNQKLVLFDDWMQSRDPEDMLEGAMELVRVKNTTPYPLKMADLSSKGNTRFDSPMVIITSNVDIPRSINVHSSLAIRRRRDVVATIGIDQRFMADDRLDPMKVYKYNEETGVTLPNGDIPSFSMDVYRITISSTGDDTNPGRPIPGLIDLTYDQFVDYCLQRWKVMVLSETALEYELDNLPAYFEAQGFECPDFQCILDKVKMSGEKVTEELLESWSSLYGLSKENIKNKLIKIKLNKPNLEVLSKYRDIFVNEMVTWKDQVLLKLEEYPILKLLGVLITSLGFVGLTMSWMRDYANNEEEDVSDVLLESHVSGDFKTRAPMKHVLQHKPISNMIIESHTSGDFKTRTPHKSVLRFTPGEKISLEGCVSGDNKTRLPIKSVQNPPVSNFVIEGSRIKFAEDFEEGSMIDMSKIEALSEVPLAEGCSDPQALNLARTQIRNNLCFVTLRSKHSKYSIQMNGLFVKGRALVTPQHLFEVVDKKENYLMDIHMKGNKFVGIEFELVKIISKKCTDVAMLILPKQYPSKPDITHHFASSEDLGRLPLSEAILMSMDEVRDGCVSQAMRYLDTVTMIGPMKYKSINSSDTIQINGGYRYVVNTSCGDCGSVLIWLQRKARSKILGFHVAGASNFGVSTNLTKEILDEFLFHLDRIAPQVSIKVPELSGDPTLLAQGFLQDVSNIAYAGSVSPQLGFRNPGNTNIVPSLLYGKLFEPVTAPALLRRQGGIDPMWNGVRKQFVDSIVFPQKLIEIASLDYKKHVLSLPSNSKRYGILSIEQAINGVEGEEWICPMNLKTSPGFPFVFFRKGVPGKYKFVDNIREDFSAMKPYIVSMVERRIQLARENSVVFSLFCDTLKDERRSIEKVTNGMTRVFNTGPFDLNVVVRMYFGSFCAHLMSNHNIGECSVGINPHSIEWKMLFDRLNQQDGHWVAGDFSNYDKTLPWGVILAAIEIINSWYDDGEENARIRVVLAITIFQGFHLCGRQVYQMHQGNPSGIAITVIINSMVNSLLKRMAFIELSKRYCFSNTISQFNSLVTQVNYGDDDLMKVSSEAHWFDFENISRWFSEYGIKYTLPDKGGDIYELTQDRLVYLKRGFRVTARGNVFAPLNWSSMTEMINWVRDTLSPQEALAQNVDAFKLELFHYGRPMFDVYSEKVDIAAASVGVECRTLLYDDFFAMWSDDVVANLMIPDEFETECCDMDV